MADETKKTVSPSGIETPEELAAINKAQEETITAQIAEIENLKKKLEEANKTGKPVSTEPTEFKLGKETYPFPAPKFHVPSHGTMTATEALKKPEVLKWLVEQKAGPIE